MQLIHRSVVDTSVVFPHKLGPPLKRALRSLAEEHLAAIIQDAGARAATTASFHIYNLVVYSLHTVHPMLLVVGGHSCEEDARTCMQLMLKKVAEDMTRAATAAASHK